MGVLGRKLYSHLSLSAGHSLNKVCILNKEAHHLGFVTLSTMLTPAYLPVSTEQADATHVASAVAGSSEARKLGSSEARKLM